MFKILLLLLIPLGLVKIQAQHCEWDNTNVIMVEIRDEISNQIIDDLQLILADSTGKPYTSEWNLRNNQNSPFYQKTDTLRFSQIKIKSNNTWNEDYKFVDENYLLLVYYNNYFSQKVGNSDQIMIKDPLKRYPDFSLNFDESKIASFCTSSKIRKDSAVLESKKIKIKLNKSHQ